MLTIKRKCARVSVHVCVEEKREQKSDGGRQRLTSEELQHRTIKRYLAHNNAGVFLSCVHGLYVCVLVQIKHSRVL